jgi:hypothetical protein
MRPFHPLRERQGNRAREKAKAVPQGQLGAKFLAADDGRPLDGTVGAIAERPDRVVSEAFRQRGRILADFGANPRRAGLSMLNELSGLPLVLVLFSPG